MTAPTLHTGVSERSRTRLTSALAFAVSLLAAACSGGQDRPGAEPLGDDDTVVVAAGDLVCQPDDETTSAQCQHEATADLAESLDPDYVFALGDLQYPHGEAANFEAGYDKTWGRFKDITRPVPGNHEYDDGSGAGYYGYWGGDAFPPNGWYSFDVDPAGWHVVALNSNCEWLGCGEDSEQMSWLRQDLQTTMPDARSRSSITRSSRPGDIKDRAP